MQYIQMVIQVGLLAAVASIGIAFTFALPRPRNVLKAKSASYARWFLVTACLVVAFQAIVQSGYPVFALPGVYGSSVLSAYMLFMSVTKRYGNAVSLSKKVSAAMHVILLVTVTLLLGFNQADSWFGHALALSSAAFPIWLAIRCVQRNLSTETVGGHLLFGVLLLVLCMLLIGIPTYLANTSPASELHFTVTFSFMLLVMLIFMLAFAVNILQSLLSKLHSQVHTDPLTGAKNRHFFYEAAPKLSAHAVRNHEVLSVVACDIDHFKQINDEYGHVIGDIALKRFCQIIQRELRIEDTLIRMGGEEFLILSPGCDADQAKQLAERLRQIISDTQIIAREVSISLTASFGVIQMPANADLLWAVKSADKALFDAKAKGRNRVIVV